MKTRRFQIPTAAPGQTYSCQPTIIADRHEPGIIDEARRLSHDTLIRRLGTARRSGVWWTDAFGARAAKEYRLLMADFRMDLDPESLERLDNNPRAAMVIAWCLSTAPPVPKAPNAGEGS